jgi:Domain of unknown function (DUF1996)
MRRIAAFILAFVILGPLPASAHAPIGIWITSCLYDHTTVADPIGHAMHIHDFVGATTIVDDSAMPESMRAGGTSCGTVGDTSGYWVPQLYEDGNVVRPDGTARDDLFYYMRQTSATVQTIPDGLKMVLGNPHAMTPSEEPGLGTKIFFKCGPSAGAKLPQPPVSCTSGIMVISFVFPNCWDGVHLDSDDHISHMAYPVGGACPPDHPVNLPVLQAFWRYPVGKGPIGTITLSSGDYYTAHMDFFNAWDPARLQDLVDRCLNGGINCKTNPV